MGLFDIFKKNKRLKTPVDLSVLESDIHSHLIPNIDDGSKGVEDSVKMISALHQLGYNKIITTPHIMGDFYKNTPENILSGLEKVKQSLKEENIPVELSAAAEYYLDYDFEKKLDEEKLLTFGNNYLLFEVSYMNPPDNMNHMIFKMQTLGYRPVLAHPERYNFWHTEFEKYESFIDKGVLLQMNINSLTGYYSIPTKRIAEQMIDKNMISFLGTDCHHIGHVNLMKEVVYEKHLQTLIESGTLLNKSL
ncbi:MAG: capsular biosynthesis protein [Bacteroidetes bacterium RIFCSPLOWO2_12_FULL_35_15]|nr:MAG: capsular biosynthesis protein [Bacteroidetes bacterium RIFCSPLOWO2_12_FULL_35_15]